MSFVCSCPYCGQPVNTMLRCHNTECPSKGKDLSKDICKPHLTSEASFNTLLVYQVNKDEGIVILSLAEWRRMFSLALAGAMVKPCEREFSANDFKRMTGNLPEDDDLARLNCRLARAPGHELCGYCEKHDKPQFLCDCFNKVRRVKE